MRHDSFYYLTHDDNVAIGRRVEERRGEEKYNLNG